MVHAPQFRLYDNQKRRAIQDEFNALHTGRCVSCDDELEGGKSIFGQCKWCLQPSNAYRPLA